MSSREVKGPWDGAADRRLNGLKKWWAKKKAEKVVVVKKRGRRKGWAPQKGGKHKRSNTFPLTEVKKEGSLKESLSEEEEEEDDPDVSEDTEETEGDSQDEEEVEGKSAEEKMESLSQGVEQKKLLQLMSEQFNSAAISKESVGTPAKRGNRVPRLTRKRKSDILDAEDKPTETASPSSAVTPSSSTAGSGLTNTLKKVRKDNPETPMSMKIPPKMTRKMRSEYEKKNVKGVLEEKDSSEDTASISEASEVEFKGDDANNAKSKKKGKGRQKSLSESHADNDSGTESPVTVAKGRGKTPQPTSDDDQRSKGQKVTPGIGRGRLRGRISAENSNVATPSPTSRARGRPSSKEDSTDGKGKGKVEASISTPSPVARGRPRKYPIATEDNSNQSSRTNSPSGSGHGKGKQKTPSTVQASNQSSSPVTTPAVVQGRLKKLAVDESDQTEPPVKNVGKKTKGKSTDTDGTTGSVDELDQTEPPVKNVGKKTKGKSTDTDGTTGSVDESDQTEPPVKNVGKKTKGKSTDTDGTTGSVDESDQTEPPVKNVGKKTKGKSTDTDGTTGSVDESDQTEPPVKNVSKKTKGKSTDTDGTTGSVDESDQTEPPVKNVSKKGKGKSADTDGTTGSVDESDQTEPPVRSVGKKTKGKSADSDGTTGSEPLPRRLSAPPQVEPSPAPDTKRKRLSLSRDFSRVSPSLVGKRGRQLTLPETLKKQEAAATLKKQEAVTTVKKQEAVTTVKKQEVVTTVKKPEVVTTVKKPEVVTAVMQEVVTAVKKPEVVTAVKKPEVVTSVKKPEVVTSVKKPEVVTTVKKPEVVTIAKSYPSRVKKEEQESEVNSELETEVKTEEIDDDEESTESNKKEDIDFKTEMASETEVLTDGHLKSDLFTKTGKKKKKHFRGLRYSFGNKKKKKGKKPLVAGRLDTSQETDSVISEDVDIESIDSSSQDVPSEQLGQDGDDPTSDAVDNEDGEIENSTKTPDGEEAIDDESVVDSSQEDIADEFVEDTEEKVETMEVSTDDMKAAKCDQEEMEGQLIIADEKMADEEPLMDTGHTLAGEEVLSSSIMEEELTEKEKFPPMEDCQETDKMATPDISHETVGESLPAEEAEHEEEEIDPGIEAPIEKVADQFRGSDHSMDIGDVVPSGEDVETEALSQAPESEKVLDVSSGVVDYEINVCVESAQLNSASVETVKDVDVEHPGCITETNLGVIANDLTTEIISHEAAPIDGDNEAAPIDGDDEAAPIDGDDEAAPIDGDDEAAPEDSSNEAAPEESSNEIVPEVSPNKAAPEVSYSEAAQEISFNEATTEVSLNETVPEVSSNNAADPEVGSDDVSPEVDSNNAAPEVSSDVVAPEVGSKNAATEVSSDDASQEVGFNEATPEIISNEAAEVGSNEAAEVRSNEIAQEVRTEEAAPAVSSNEVTPEVSWNEAAPEVSCKEAAPEVSGNEVAPEVICNEPVPDDCSKETAMEVIDNEDTQVFSGNQEVDLQVDQFTPNASHQTKVMEEQVMDSSHEMEASLPVSDNSHVEKLPGESVAHENVDQQPEVNVPSLGPMKIGDQVHEVASKETLSSSEPQLRDSTRRRPSISKRKLEDLGVEGQNSDSSDSLGEARSPAIVEVRKSKRLSRNSSPHPLAISAPRSPEGGGIGSAKPIASQSAFVAAPSLTNVLCKCRVKENPVAVGITGDVYCKGVDSFDGRMIGCCNVVTDHTYYRVSGKIPFMLLCDIHRERLRLHNCCPWCGLFCTQGVFSECTWDKNGARHYYHKLCSLVLAKSALCPHCGSDQPPREVQLELKMNRKPVIYLQQQQERKGVSARMSWSKKEEEAVVNTESKIPDDEPTLDIHGNLISAHKLPHGLDRQKLQEAIRSINAGKPSTVKPSGKAMYWACKQHDLDKLLHLLISGISPNIRVKEYGNQTGLHVAASYNMLGAVHVLLLAGATLDMMDMQLMSPLMVAITKGHNEVSKYLIQAGASLMAKNQEGMTSLHLAAKWGNFLSCQYIIDSGRLTRHSINTQDEGGWTPLVWASENRYISVVKFLLDRGGNPQLCDVEQNTALHWAAFSGSTQICAMLLDRGCSLRSMNAHGDTPLHIAARQNHTDAVVLFLARGARLDILNSKQQTPLDCAIADTDVYLQLSLNSKLQNVMQQNNFRIEKILSSDIAAGKEEVPIPCVNGMDDDLLPKDYLYIAENCEASNVMIDRTITSLKWCECEDGCNADSCECGQLNFQCWYDPDGRLLSNFNYTDPPMIFECNRACRCNKLSCNNRVVQHGISAHMQLFKTDGKGWGVRALKTIQKGSYVCEYVGEIITDLEADQREDDSYLFDLDNRDSETFCIDARGYGNIARFVNHLCEPNLTPVKVFIDHQDLTFPRIALFANREIEADEELGFDYGEKFWIIKYKHFTCTCGSEKCKYSSETIHTTLENYNKKAMQASKFY